MDTQTERRLTGELSTFKIVVMVVAAAAPMGGFYTYVAKGIGKPPALRQPSSPKTYEGIGSLDQTVDTPIDIRN